jgi:hypothetical protein
MRVKRGPVKRVKIARPGDTLKVNRLVEPHQPKVPTQQGLFLDDERTPKEVTWIRYDGNIEWTIVRNADQFRKAMTSKVFDVYSFDWYLGHGVTDGLELIREFAVWLKANRIKPYESPTVITHSQLMCNISILDDERRGKLREMALIAQEIMYGD